MIKGLYSAASAMIANETLQKVLAHNTANLETPGFKQTMLTLDDYIQAAVTTTSENPIPIGSENLIGYQGLGVLTSDEVVDFSQGPLKETDEIYDVAIEGDGFFVINTPDGDRYTRDGRFVRDAEGQLVTVDGYYVLDTDGNQIEIPDGSNITISPDGTINVDGEAVAQIGLASFEDPETELSKDGDNLFISTGDPTGETVGTLHQGYLEYSNASSAELMAQSVTISRAYEAAQKMVQIQDELIGKSIASLGSI